jgi:hypothetical protein
MDATNAQAAVDTAQSAVDAATTALEAANVSLAQAKSDLANITQINDLEALTPEQVTAINEALATDADNKSGITLALPAADPAA